MEKKLWPQVDKDLIKPPGWILSKRGQRQKKRQRQLDEDVMTQSQGTSKMKKKGSVVMTCSVCGLTGHNKRYHEKKDAPHEDWDAYPVEPLENPNTSIQQRGIGQSNASMFDNNGPAVDDPVS
ncbi:Uncharacterized protein Adt_12971 [Abeliophyllum distichum]|uniref:Uncharacterized protein n=1 Tax=Abeliophyllum distichum TaxID=126358 RepID=A0ABD1TVH3_9LAMI